MKDWHFGSGGKWVSMGVISDGSHYGIPANIVFGFPMVCEGGKYRIIDNVPVSEESKRRIEISRDELLNERKAIEDFLWCDY